MKTYTLKVVVEPDEDRWHAWCPALREQGAAASGHTREEALKNIKEVAHLVIESIVEHNDPIRPNPRWSWGDDSACLMPTISEFYGIFIRMYYNDHSPPHFYARFGEPEATININTRTMIEGDLPVAALEQARKWARMNKAVLVENWRLCREKSPPKRIDPLP